MFEGRSVPKHTKCCVKSVEQQLHQLCTVNRATAASAVYSQSSNSCISCVQSVEQELHQLCTVSRARAASAVYSQSSNSRAAHCGISASPPTQWSPENFPEILLSPDPQCELQ